MTNKEAFNRWAETHKLMTVTFYWYNKGSESECRLHDRTYNEALKVAMEFGYKEPRWYNPWTWKNGVVAVG